MGYESINAASAQDVGAARLVLIAQGQNQRAVIAFTRATAAYWCTQMCRVCADAGGSSLCRRHLREALLTGGVDREEVSAQRATVDELASHMLRYEHSFIWGAHEEATMEDQAALIGAIGWLSGWRPWLVLTRGREHTT